MSKAARRARTLCAVRGCPAHAVDGSRCEQHRRTNSRAWRKIAARTIERAGGICERCDREATLSAHHVDALVDGGREIVTLDKTLALCASCQTIESPQPERRPNG